MFVTYSRILSKMTYTFVMSIKKIIPRTTILFIFSDHRFIAFYTSNIFTIETNTMIQA